MYPRTLYQLTQGELEELLNAGKPTLVMRIGGYTPPGPQENANRAWEALGKKRGFDSTTVRPDPNRGHHWFTAIPSETEEQGAERLKKEKKEKRLAEIKRLEDEITERKQELKILYEEEE